MALFGGCDPSRCRDVAKLLKKATTVQKENVRAALHARDQQLSGLYESQLEADEALNDFEDGAFDSKRLAAHLTPKVLSEIFD
jgi:hypothetical protein